MTDQVLNDYLKADLDQQDFYLNAVNIHIKIKLLNELRHVDNDFDLHDDR